MFIPIWLLAIIVFLIAGAFDRAEKRAESAERDLESYNDTGDQYESDYDN